MPAVLAVGPRNQGVKTTKPYFVSSHGADDTFLRRVGLAWSRHLKEKKGCSCAFMLGQTDTGFASIPIY